MAMNLTSIGIAQVVGWDGPVADSAATDFAAEFYRLLQSEQTVTYACAMARRKLFRQSRQQWHLGRAVIGPCGGGRLVDAGQPARPRRAGRSCHDLLDKVKNEVQVASRATFVGRRLQTKQVLQAFEQRKKAGVLLYGVGGTGKSSLAARIVDRLEPGYKAVVIYRDYDPFAILNALEQAARSNNNQEIFPQLIEKVSKQPDSLQNVLVNLLEQQFFQHPIVLVVDDLEQHILERPATNRETVSVKPEYQTTLAAIINAFDIADSQSNLLFTSRYRFALPDQKGGNLSAKLYAINVPEMTVIEQQRHWLALLQASQANQQRDHQADSRYLKQIFQLSSGNPGLQDLLFNPLLHNELNALEQALEKIAAYQATHPIEGNPSEDIDKFLQRLALATYTQALTNTERELLRVLTLFSFAVPKALLIQVGPSIGIDDPTKALTRLDNFGLLNHWQGLGLEQHISCYQLAKWVVEPLSEDDKNQIAQLCALLAPE